MRPILKQTTMFPERILVALSKEQLDEILDALSIVSCHYSSDDELPMNLSDAINECEEAYQDLTGEPYFEDDFSHE
jgi:hypothetical protein